MNYVLTNVTVPVDNITEVSRRIDKALIKWFFTPKDTSKFKHVSTDHQIGKRKER